MTMLKPDVLVIGGGVIGASCARELALGGASVILMDKGDPGYGCSYGNAGWLTPCFAMPLPMPGMFLKSIKWLLNPDSPLYIRPQPSPILARWLVRFLLSMTRSKAASSISALTEISKYSLAEYKALADRNPGLLSFQRRGLLMVGQSEEGFRTTVDERDWVAPHGIPGRIVNEEEARALEPALVGRLRGGVYFPDEAHAEPLAAVQLLLDEAIRAGATVLGNTEVWEFETENGVLKSVMTTRGRVQASKYVLALGSWSQAMARRLGLRVPVLGGKGYAITTDSLEVKPRLPMMLIEKKVAVTPRAGSTRLAGTLELVNQDYGITARRVRALLNGAREFLSVPQEPRIQELWRGLRPCTPDGVPVIGESQRLKNVLVATGHQMLGLQTAPATGRLIADLALGRTPAFDPKPFRLERF